MTSWASPEQAAAIWPGAGDLEPATLADLLAVATEACAAYAPALAIDQEPPARYRHAVVLHARDLRRAGLAAEDGSVGPDGFIIRPRPLTATVRQLLRPALGRPRFGTGRRSTETTP